MPRIRANGLEIAYEEIGDGPPLVLLHGASTTGRVTFAAQIPALAETFRLFLPDARGHGRTRWDAADGFEAEWLVDDLEAFVDGLGLRSFHLIGYSMGAMTALGFAVRAPERLSTLVVVGITTAREPRASIGRRLMDPERILRDDPAWATEMTLTIDAGQGPGAWQRLLPAIAADIDRQPLLTPGDLRTIEAPTLVAVGDHDPLVPVGQAWELSRQVRDGRLFVAPDSGHDVLTRRPALALEALRGFYRSTESIAQTRADALPEVPPMTTLLALYRRPDGGPDAQATFERRYAAEHLPLVAGTPGLRETRISRVVEALGGATDLILVTAMRFDDREALDAGLGSDAMRAAGRNLREIAPGLSTLLVLEDVPEMDAAASLSVDTV